MQTTINNVYPWGRSLEEYRLMFRLTDEDLGRRILGCADGPAAFNAGMHRLGHRVVSCDPLYQFGSSEIRARIKAVVPGMIANVEREHHRFVWNAISSPAEMARARMKAMDEFLADYDCGRAQGRYVISELPRLGFEDGAFDLALCSHFLFLYSDEWSERDHIASVLELCRAAIEVRIFPLLDMKGERSRHLEPVIQALRDRGLRPQVEQVSYEFQRGGNEMMRINRT